MRFGPSPYEKPVPSLKEQVLEARRPFKHQLQVYNTYCNAAKPLLEQIHQHRVYFGQFCQDREPVCDLIGDDNRDLFTVRITPSREQILFDLDIIKDSVTITHYTSDGHRTEQQPLVHPSQLAYLFSQLVVVHSNFMLELKSD